MEATRILVVEDNPVIRDLVRLGIAKLGAELGMGGRIEVEHAGDGGSAWDQIQKWRPDLVVLDLYLPVLNGIDVIRRVRSTPELASTGILAISASVHDARDRSLGAGADQFLQKPIRLVELLEAVRSILHSRKP